MSCVFLAVLVILLTERFLAMNMQWTLEQTPGVRYTNPFDETTTLSAAACAYLCVWTGRCFVANYNSGTMACTLIEDASTFVSDIDWHSFIVVSGMPVFLRLPMSIKGIHYTYLPVTIIEVG